MNKNEQMRDPRWQKKRLLILHRDGFKCTRCGSGEKELHVHHIKYSKTLWDVDNSDLQTLCVDCHAALGAHPKGGIGWREEGFFYTHCPLCGGTEYKDKGWLEKCMQCGHTIVPSEWP